MSYDLEGIKVKNEKVECFHNSNWLWAPLREYVLVYASDCLNDKEKEYWNYNDGNVVREEQAIDIGNKLLALIEEGHTGRYEDLCLKIFECPFSVENVQNFAEFCMNSGGFAIC
jgi:hypothetical protein